MNLYRVSPSLPFLEILANFILDNFGNKESINNLKVILPNGIACLNLQDILIKKQTLAILPKIIPLSNIIAEGEEIFKFPAEDLAAISLLQEKIILTEIIHNYPKLKFNAIVNSGEFGARSDGATPICNRRVGSNDVTNFSSIDYKQAVQFSSIISELFYALACHHLSIDDVDIIEQQNLSSHWNSIFEFLQYIEHAWKKKLSSLRKQDRVKWQITMMEAEILRLQHSNSRLIIAGIVGSDLISWKFLKDIANLPTGFIILPPIDQVIDNLLNKQEIAEEDCLYNFKKLLGFLGCNLSDFQLLGVDAPYNTILNKLITENNDQEGHKQNAQYPTSIKYLEFEDIFTEAEQIALLCRKYINKKIAIIVDNPLVKSFYCNFLTKYSLEFQDLLGNNLSQTSISSLITSIHEILCNDFDLKKLLLLLKNPLINSQLVQELELLIKGKNRFILSTTQLLSLIESSNNNELIEWGRGLIKLLYPHTDNNFIKILKSTVKIAEKLYPDIWYDAAALELSNFLAELIQNECNLVNKKDFPELLKTLMKGCKYLSPNLHFPNIIVGKVEDLVLLKFDLVILADFNHGTWSSYSSVNTWINERTLQKLQIISSKTKTSIYQYFFYLLLYNNEVIITRAKRQDGKSGVLPSNLLLKLELLLGDKLLRQTPIIINNNSPPAELANKQDYIHSPIFPDILSATNIEMLIRNPYSFYAKTILKLRPKEIIGQDPKISEFGIFIHKILEQYSTNYDKSASDQLQSILDISYDIMHHTTLPSYTKKIWQMKFTPIAKAFIEFDEERRKNFKYVYPECRGEISLTISGQELKIMAVADRIEVNEQRQAVIIDYKTGTLPNKKEVESGLSPQLIIEALILVDGGFGLQNIDVQQIMYVKFSSSPPYLQTVAFDLSKEELNRHRQGMLYLLEHYITNKNFSAEIDLLTYNDYEHLARTISAIKTI